MLTPRQKQYFDTMRPGDELLVANAKSPAGLVAAGKEYIDLGGLLTFSDDYARVMKPNPIPTDDKIYILCD